MSDPGAGIGISTSPEKYQSNTSATPSFPSATYPSSDIDMSAITVVIVGAPFIHLEHHRRVRRDRDQVGDDFDERSAGV